jgi:hypothetical protein
MPLDTEIRTAVREVYGHSCGYCGVSELWVGGELEIDHFRPLRHGGADTLDNLVYACTICNRFKSDYWHADDAPDNLRLLHPFKDDLDVHLLQTSDGKLAGLTPRGRFHIDRLHLNRPLLVELRRFRHAEHLLRQELNQVQTANAQLQRRIWALEIELAELRELVARLSA